MQRNLVRPTPSAAQGIAMADIQGPLLQLARLQSSPRRAQRRRLHPGSLVLCLKHSTGAQVAQPRAAGIKTKMGDLGCDQSTAPYTRPHCKSRCDGHWLLLVSHRCNRMYSLLLTMPSSLPSRLLSSRAFQMGLRFYLQRESPFIPRSARHFVLLLCTLFHTFAAVALLFCPTERHMS